MGVPIKCTELDRWYDYHSTAHGESSNMGGSYIFVRIPTLALLLSGTIKLQRAHLIEIGGAHGVKIAKGLTIEEMKRRLLLGHKCRLECSHTVYNFKGRISERGIKKVVTSTQKRKTAREDGAASAGVGGRGQKRSSVDAQATRVGVSEGSDFPLRCPRRRRNEIMEEFQAYMNEANYTYEACAVCGQKKLPRELSLTPIADVPLQVLQNEDIPEELEPVSYNFELYQRAYLCAAGMQNTDMLDDIKICTSCQSSLAKEEQPPDSIANYQYYAYECLPADIAKAFAESSMHERQLIAACRASRITYLYTVAANNLEGRSSEFMPPQGFIKGNVGIFPQDVGRLGALIPPAPKEVDYCMCVVFMGGEPPTLEMLRKLTPVLASRSRVEKLTKFLAERNIYYRYYGIEFSEDNLNALCATESFDGDRGITTAVEVVHAPAPGSVAGAVNSDYTDRGNDLRPEKAIDIQDLLMDTVGFADELQSSVSSSPAVSMAEEWCRRRRPFIGVRTGTTLFPDRDPRMLTFLFPHLDPWGIGPFNNALRSAKQRISMQRQVHNLLNMYDSPFAKDPNFAYVCWNIIQKMENSRATTFSVKEDLYKEIAEEVVTSADRLEHMASKWLKDPYARPSDDDERRLLGLLNKLKAISHDLPGSNASKLKMRNEIRGLMKTHGTPALFITFAPSDVNSRLLYLLGGKDPDEWANLEPYERGKFVAEHPDAAAKFFDIMVKGFLEKIVRFGDQRPGLFGHCNAYYGTVEAQGRGTLHLHMVLWLRGNPNPQALRERLEADDQFKADMFEWLESNIKCELPHMTQPLNVDPQKLKKPVCESVGDPRLHPVPLHKDFSDDLEGEELFEANFNETVTSLATSCNWHVHTATCWKHLKPGQPRDSAHCRMRHTGGVRGATTLDEETKSIMLRRLHPWINNYNDVMLYLLKCNMDIKYIGSGEAAKALTYYITDYITKSSLPTHAVLSAVCAAIQKTKNLADKDEDRAKFRRSLLTKIVNGIMGKIELSYAQVMSYLVGGGDHYSSHTFRNLNWGMLDKYMRQEERKLGVHSEESAEDLNDIGGVLDTVEGAREEVDVYREQIVQDEMLRQREADVVEEEVETGNDVSEQIEQQLEPGQRDDAIRRLMEAMRQRDKPSVTIRANKKGISAGSLLLDYRLRSTRAEYEQLSVWEHVSSVHCLTNESEARRVDVLEKENVNRQGQGRRGRKAAARVKFASSEHPRYKTHVSRLRTVPLIPVVLGPTLAKRGRTDAEDEQWYRAMLVLFKPWRSFQDLRGDASSWKDAFERVSFQPHLLKIMRNINVETECRDAKRRYETARLAGDAEPLLAGAEGVIKIGTTPDDELLLSLRDDASLNTFHIPGRESESEDVEQSDSPLLLTGAQIRVQECMRVLEDTGIVSRQHSTHSGGAMEIESTAHPPFVRPPEDVARRHEEIMRLLKRNKRPDRAVSSTQADELSEASPVYPTRLAKTSKMKTFNAKYMTATAEEIHALPITSGVRRYAILEEILEDFKVVETPENQGNIEQELAIRRICEHAIRKDSHQLLLHISGVGGTGKSHVIQAVREFFRRCEMPQRVQISAPTGIAAVLINGYTIHALTFLPQVSGQGFAREKELQELWKGVKYLVIDEVSMLSAQFLAQISKRLGIATGKQALPFGGLNVIFTGDFGQLPPVKLKALYDHRLLDCIGQNQGQSEYGQDELNGAYLWRQVTEVICLKKNMRSAADPEYAALVGRIRVGKPVTHTDVQQGIERTDYRTLHSRTLSAITRRSPTEAQAFENCPVIVVDKQLRDAINMRIVRQHAQRRGVDMRYLRARDRIGGQFVSDDVQRQLLNLTTNKTGDLLGAFPYIPGMSVMIQENLDLMHKAVNGSEGILLDVDVDVDDNGNEYAKCAYVHVKDSGLHLDGLPPDVVPIYPSSKSYTYRTGGKGKAATHVSISRLQLPLVPAYAYTDYKSQGRSLDRAIVDIASCRRLQSLYVMLSRVRTLDGLALLRPCTKAKFERLELNHAARSELQRLDDLHAQTILRYRAA